MVMILKSYGISEGLVTAISKMYEDITAKVITPDREMVTFKNLAGILQGVTLDPYLFVIYIDYVTRTDLIRMEDNKVSYLEKDKSEEYHLSLLQK